MNVLLAGSHGLIGSALAQRLGERGDRVVRLVRGGPAPVGPAGRQTAPDQPPDEVDWDPAARSIDREALEAAGPYDAVVNLAGAGIGDRRWSPSRRREILESRVQTTQTLAQVLAQLRPQVRVMVNASAVGFYGDRGDQQLTEDSPAGQGFLAEVCRQWEAAATPAGSEVRLVLVRSGIVLSAQGGALARQLPLFRAGLGGRLGSGRQFVSWITLDDEVGIIVSALDDERMAGPLNATAPTPVRNLEFTRALGSCLGRPTFLHVPGAALSVLLGSQMAKELLLASQRVVPSRLEELGHRFEHPEIDGALRALLSAPGPRGPRG